MNNNQVNQQLATQAAKHFEAALDRRRKDLKSEFIQAYVLLALAHGYDLGRGDVALVHQDDVPMAVHLFRGVDPIWINSRIVEPGKTLFVASHLKSLPLYAGLNA